MTDDLDFIGELLQSGSQYGSKQEERDSRYPVPPQKGPLRYYDNGNMRCLSSRCGSPTHYKFRGVPYCTTHALRKMNEELTNEDE
jgi:hypothetical protein